MILKNKMHFKTSKKIFFFISICLIALTTKANQSQHLSRLFVKSQAKVTEIDYEYFNTHQAKESFKYFINLGEYGTYELELKPSDLFVTDFKISLQKESSLPLTFSGKIADIANSQVSLTVNQNFMSGYVFNGETTIYFEPLNNFNKQAKTNELIIYDEKDVLNEKYYCAHNHQPMSFKVDQQEQHFANRTACDKYTVEMVLVADYGMFQKYGSATAVRNQITSIINAAQTNFDNEFNDPIIFKVVDEYIATNADNDLWDRSEKNSEKLLEEFAESNFTSKIFDLASLWVTRKVFYIKDDGTQIDVAGLAYNRGLCKNASKFNLLKDSDAPFAFLRTTCAHEIGHNFSADHDEDDTEFIMTPGTSSNKWSTTSLDRINSFYPNTNCLCSTEFVDFVASGRCISGGSGGITRSTATFQNFGNVASEPTVIGLFLSEDEDVTIDDHLLSKVNFETLQPGEARSERIVLDFSNANLPCGDYHYGIIVDAENNIAEPNESNNVACKGTYTITDCPTPDLTLENCASVTITGNTINTGSITLKNIGNGNATSALVGYYLFKDNNEYLIAQSNFPALTAGGSFNRTIARNISEVSPPLPAGDYTISIRADRKNTISESNESNNNCIVADKRFTVSYGCKDASANNYTPNATYSDNTTCEYCAELNCPADLVIENCSTVRVIGNTINTGKFTVRNIGGTASVTTLLGVYLSTDATIDNNDYLIAQSNFAALQPGESISRVLARDISSVNSIVPTGTYYAGFLADRKNVLSEANEGNNSCYDPLFRFTRTTNKIASNKITDSYNYPNPFTATTSINYTLIKDAKINITVYDAMGNQITSLINNKTQKAGEYSVEFDGSNIPAGIYYYRIQGNDFDIFQKMILMK